MLQRINNLTFGRAFACIFTSALLTFILKIANDALHIGISNRVAVCFFTALLLYRFWYVSKTPPPNYDQPFGHM